MSSSGLYEGWVRHRRLEPVEHSFRYPLFMAYVDLAELPEVLDPLRGWSARRPALAWLRRSDQLGDPSRPLSDCVRDAVEGELGERPRGPIRTLTNLRYFGHCFNPVSFHFCFAPGGERVAAVLADVSNTPWGERHAYAIRANGSRVISARIEKRLHVSPLMGMDHVYEWRTTVPGDDLQVHIESRREGRVAFEATLSLRRRKLAPDTARRMLIRYPAMTAGVVARIYWQALRLRLKGAPWHPHPERSR
ncbi:MAG: DUF1365 domain-containing protein [Solirubrobacterales bacterium]